jgi:hypothetical protein
LEAVERLRRKDGPAVRGAGPVRDDGTDDSAPGRLAVGLGVAALVGDDGARRNIGAGAEQGLELTAVAGPAAGDPLPSLALAAETCAHHFAVEHLHQVRRSAQPRERLEPPFRLSRQKRFQGGRTRPEARVELATVK